MREDMTRSPSIPSTLPPPYTATGTRGSSLRTNPQNFCSTAELLVGSRRTRFLIHTQLLVEQSPYFRAALTGSFLESNAKSIELDDVLVDVFELCVGWLYTGSIHAAPFKDGKPAYYTLLHLYILADRLCFEGLRNAVVDMISELADSTNSVLTPSDTRILYEQIMPDAPIRKLILDLFAFKKTDKLIKDHEDRWHAEFLRDLCVHLKRPCEQALRRHQLRMWIPESWHATRACDVCRCILPPRYGAVGCDECCLAWCIRCVGEGVALAGWEDGRTLSDGTVERREGSGMAKMSARKRGVRRWESCKPWRGARCGVYHEHKETDSCGDVFMGR
ncbi:hypothetical protein BDV96DRAFT_618446 [Lophiotrema nucula]|uniref:BTB domain-containing protein n=1 Tax=Lophiotrema nucula TaxID=690887 RepID=A0A6A5ZQJ5_9PLEO|nr:hypothetical protein BDV96DRAFT_618446 [Lophiotrema nucula]